MISAVMEQVGRISHTFAEADEWDVQQQLEMSPQERLQAAHELKFRIYPRDSPDVRQCHRPETER